MSGEEFEVDEEPNWVDQLDDEASFYVEPARRREVRKLFLQAIEEHAPAVLQGLRTMVHCFPKEGREHGHLDTPLSRWASRFHLFDERSEAGDWILEAARRTLSFWDTLDEMPSPPKWSPDADEVELEESSTFGPPSQRELDALSDRLKSPLQFDSPSWDPCKEGVEEYRMRAAKEFAEALDLKLNIISRTMHNRNSKVPPEKRRDEHCGWLVLFQVCNWNYTKIGEAEAVSPRKKEVRYQSVSEGVESMARLLFGNRWKFWLRRAGPGRPRERARPLTNQGSCNEDD